MTVLKKSQRNDPEDVPLFRAKEEEEEELEQAAEKLHKSVQIDRRRTRREYLPEIKGVKGWEENGKVQCCWKV